MRPLRIAGMLAVGMIFLAATAARSRNENYPLSTALEGPDSPYTRPLLELAKAWNPGRFVLAPPDSVLIRCIETKDQPYYVGAEQFMEISAPLSVVAEVLDDFAHYKDLFPDFADIHLVSRDQNKLVTYWEEKVPVFFLPNAKYFMGYVIETQGDFRKIYRYKLKESHDLKYSDGIIVIEKSGSGSTHYAEYDFFDAVWGAVKIGADRFWHDSIRGVFLTDAAVKLKAENPTFSYERIEELSKKMLERFPLDEVLGKRSSFPIIEKPGQKRGLATF